MSEDEIIERLMLMEQWKVSGNICTQEELNSIGMLLDLYEKKSKMVEMMAEALTTPLLDTTWIIKYYENKVKLKFEITGMTCAASSARVVPIASCPSEACAQGCVVPRSAGGHTHFSHCPAVLTGVLAQGSAKPRVQSQSLMKSSSG